MKKWNRARRFGAAWLLAAAVSVNVPGNAGFPVLRAEAAQADSAEKTVSPSFDVSKFVLPASAAVLVVVEGTGGYGCNVYAYEWSGGPGGAWQERLSTTGILGKNGLSNHRTSGDKTTPIGLFEMNTPFGQSKAEEGFPENYVQVSGDYVWSDLTNTLKQGSDDPGEKVGTSRYAGYYDYAIDAGFNRAAMENQGSALFLHCMGPYSQGTSGCVAIPKEEMAKIMKLYGTYGDGCAFIAQAPAGTFDQIYSTFGANGGLSPDGNF